MLHRLVAVQNAPPRLRVFLDRLVAVQKAEARVWLESKPTFAAQHQTLEDHNPVLDEDENRDEPRADHFLPGPGTEGFENLLTAVE